MNNNAGFTLIEVLVTVIILAVGLLGLAGLQTTGLRSNLSAYHRSQATQLAYDIADRMRANKTAANNYLTSFMTPANASIQNDCSTTSNTCTAADMAENDLFQWNQFLTSASTLPGGTATITVAGRIYTIQITWTDRDPNKANPVFLMSFEL